MKICQKCNIHECKRSVCDQCKRELKLKYSREKSKKIRDQGQDFIYLKCKFCQNICEIKKYKERIHLKKGGPICQKCRNKISSNKLKIIREKQTPTERSEWAKYARSFVKDSRASVLKQWDTIRNDPKRWENMQNQRSLQGKLNWNNRSDEQKSKQLKSWLAPKSRSKVSEQLKNAMIKNNIYDGFVSEEPFHGFIPDEINHKLKIIVELYGDLYHCNPRKYKDESIYIKAIRRTVGEQWKRDRIRLGCFYKHGYSVIIVWEKDFYKEPLKQIERIKDEVNKKRNFK